jgi:hypothetical protein
MIDDIKATFAKYEDDFLKFELIERPRHHRPDMCAFLMLDELAPGHGDMVCSAEHDEIWLDVEVAKLAAVVTEEQIRDLIRCGVRLDGYGESLCMFV